MNPFSYGTIVNGNNFYDRKEECARIEKTLAGGNNLVLYAPRRFGKTSLVFKAIEKLEAQGFICIYFDFMPVFSPESFVRLYAKALATKQTNGSPEFSIDFAGLSVDETIISQLLDLPEKLANVTKKRVIVFFDEFQEVEKLSNINFEGLLRSKIQQQHKTNYLFFGSKTHLLLEMFNSKKRAFYNAASQMTIGALPEQDTIDYLQQKFADSAIILDIETAKYIIAVAANIPHYIQMMAAEIWQYMINSQTIVTKEIVDECVKRLLALKNDYYMELFDHQSQSYSDIFFYLINCNN